VAPTSNPADPLVSVVLCARDAAEPLRRRLEGLCRQTLPRDDFEVVVVDDGSTDGTLEAARAFESRLPLRAARQRAAGLASARNHGLFYARGVVVLFLDAGVPEPGLLAAHLAAHRRFPEPRFAVVGEARPADELAGDPLLRFLAGAPDLEWRRGAAPAGEVRGFAHFAADGGSVKRTFLLERGVFDQSFRRCGEDVDLACRLARHGLEVVHAPEAVTRLVEATTVGAVCERLRDVGAAAVLLDARHDHPAARRLADVAGAAAAWRGLTPVHEEILRSARELDRLVRLRDEEGLPADPHDLALLERSYLAAFRASRIQGVVEGEARSGMGPLDHRSLAS
jgi:hypothetical protein